MALLWLAIVYVAMVVTGLLIAVRGAERHDEWDRPRGGDDS